MNNTREDGFSGLAPVGCFPASPTGVFDSIGNAWEWTSSQEVSSSDFSFMTSAENDMGLLGVIRGGSHLCSKNYCARYRVNARQPVAPETTAIHIGFRTVRDFDK